MTALRSRQKGISLFVVLVMVMLSMLLALWASRTALFNEMLTGNDSDYQRAFEAAQALVRDAELDIMGVKADGSPCKTDASYVGCRSAAAGAALFFPQGEEDFMRLTDALSPEATHCSNGICVDADLGSDFWADSATRTLMTASGVGATYGQFTGATMGDDSNPLLANARYWVEVLRYQVGAGALGAGGPAAALAPSSTAPFVYRITAISPGQKPGTQAVVQTIFSLKPAE